MLLWHVRPDGLPTDLIQALLYAEPLDFNLARVEWSTHRFLLP